jgi:amino acid transporter
MGLKKHLERRVRGWLPKEHNLPPHRQTKNHSTPHVNKIGTAIITMGFVGGLLGALASSFGLVSEHGAYVLAIIAAIVITDIATVVYIRKKRKKHLETTNQGWLPEEPNSPSYKRTTNHKTPKIRIQIGVVIFIMGFVGGLLGAFASSLGLFSGLGVYVSVVIIVIGITIVAATIIIRTKQKEEQQRS